MLLSRVPRLPQPGDVRLAWLNPIPIAVRSGRINRIRENDAIGYCEKHATQMLRFNPDKG